MGYRDGGWRARPPLLSSALVQLRQLRRALFTRPAARKLIASYRARDKLGQAVRLFSFSRNNICAEQISPTNHPEGSKTPEGYTVRRQVGARQKKKEKNLTPFNFLGQPSKKLCFSSTSS